MKRIRITLKTIGGQEMLTIHGPLFVGIAAERFVIDDQREPVKPRKPPKTSGAAVRNLGKGA